MSPRDCDERAYLNLASDLARKPLCPDGASEEPHALEPEPAVYRAEPGRPEARADAAACPDGSGRAPLALTRVMWASLALVPAVLIAQVSRMGGPVLFVGSVVAMVPLAWLIGEATDQAADRTGPVAAALLNASFGNAPELIITLFAVARGLGDVVRGSLVGSVAGNLLLVLGTALIAERRSGGGRLAQDEVFRSAALVAAACVVFTVTTAVGPHRLAPAPTLAAAVVLIGAYALVTVRSLHGTGRPPAAEGEPEAAGGSRWSLRRALVVLGGATLATVAMSQVLTASIEPFERAAGVPDLFVAGVVVALAGNAAEHGGAVVIAARGQIRLAGGIAMASATQVGLAVLPAVALASLFFNPLALSFRPVELACLAVTAVAPAVLLRDGRTSRRRGAALCTAYAAVVFAFLYSH
jgi:Ca2+:H+ antiporter